MSKYVTMWEKNIINPTKKCFWTAADNTNVNINNFRLISEKKFTSWNEMDPEKEGLKIFT